MESHPKGTLLFDSVYVASNEVMSKQVGRKALIFLTDGEDEGKTPATPSRTRESKAACVPTRNALSRGATDRKVPTGRV